MSSPRTRSVTPVQLVVLLAAFLCLSVLTGVLAAGLLVPAAGTAGVVAKAVPSVFEDMPADLQLIEPANESKMLDADNNTIAVFYSRERTVVSSDKISTDMKNAIVAIEDKRFYTHHGVDPEGIARALANNLGGDDTQGASTITQQYVRNMLTDKGYVTDDADLVNEATTQTAERKLREMKYALTLETQMSKDEILTGYLNVAPFGPNVYGVEASAKLYFNKSASELDYNQAALLAGLVQSPVQYDPITNPDKAQERRDIVLEQMLDQGYISQDQYDAGVAINVRDMLDVHYTTNGCTDGTADSSDKGTGYFCEYAKQQFLNDSDFGETVADRQKLLDTGGLEIKTTIQPSKQNAAYETVTSALADTSGPNGVITSIEPSTGNIRAMAQNTTFASGDAAGETMSNFSTGTYQVGSTFKLFTMMEWFKEGHTAYESVGRNNRYYSQSEFHCSNGQTVAYTPNPYKVEDIDESSKSGSMNVVKATGLSVNQAFVNMSSKLDFCNIFQTAYDFGIYDISTDEDGTQTHVVPQAIPSNVIGSTSTSPLTMASVAATLANDGWQCSPNALTSVVDSDGNTKKEYQPSSSCTQRLDTTVARQVSTLLMTANQKYYTSGSGYQNMDLGTDVQWAAKTGTTNDNANTWTVGYTSNLATAAWMGYAAESSKGVGNVRIGGTTVAIPYGSTVASYLWGPYMQKAVEGTDTSALQTASIGVEQKATPSPSSTTSSTQKNDKSDSSDSTDSQNGDSGDDSGDSQTNQDDQGGQ